MKDKNTELELINTKLREVMEELDKKVPVLTYVENDYHGKYYKLLLQAGERTQEARESSAKLQLRMPEKKGEPSLWDRYTDAKLEVRILLTKKDMLFEISRNLRAIK